MLMANKLDSVLTYLEGLLPIKSHEALTKYCNLAGSREKPCFYISIIIIPMVTKLGSNLPSGSPKLKVT